MQHCGMPVLTLADIERTIRSSLDGDTYPSDAKTPWNPAYPTRGQCGVVTLVVNDLLGGELLRGAVHVDGQRVASTGGIACTAESKLTSREISSSVVRSSRTQSPSHGHLTPR
jgi:hypothetical protein